MRQERGIAGIHSQELSETSIPRRRAKLKWLTDVTEFKYYVGPEVHKLYLSAILDLYDRRIVAYAIGDRNDNRISLRYI